MIQCRTKLARRLLPRRQWPASLEMTAGTQENNDRERQQRHHGRQDQPTCSQAGQVGEYADPDDRNRDRHVGDDEEARGDLGPLIGWGGLVDGGESRASASEDAASPAATPPMPTMRSPQPRGRAAEVRKAPSAIWPATDAAKTPNTTRPIRAWLSMPMIWLRNPGATAVKAPSTAKPAKPARAAGTKVDRTSAGTWRLCGRRRACALVRTVSGMAHTRAAAGTSSPRSTQNTSRRGEPAYSARIPASNGPVARPPMFAIVATSVARPRRSAPARSTRAAVACR